MSTQPVPQSAAQLRKPPRRRMAGSKIAAMSPEARRAAEERKQRMIDDYLARNEATKCPDRWALGAVSTSMFGTTES